jgi:hypothetical protein
MMGLTIIGQAPLARDAQGRLVSRIATIFPPTKTLVTLPGIHATQRLAYLDWVNRRRADQGLPPLSREEEDAETAASVDLIMEDDAILIRPDPANMPLAFQADELLQRLVAKDQVRFLYVWNARVRDAIKRRGECWRIAPLPISDDDMREMIDASRIAIGGREIYYYNKIVGTRFLTFQEFSSLVVLDHEELARHLTEIQQFSARKNRQGSPEVAFFMADESFSTADFAPYDFAATGPEELKAIHLELTRRFRNAVPPEYRWNEIETVEWRNAMCSALMGHDEEVVFEESLLGLGPEFFMQIQWLPGGRIEEGELIFDSIFDCTGEPSGDLPLAGLCDEKPRGFIYNLVREYGDLEYINIGRVVASLSRRPKSAGRRDVYLVELKQRGRDKEIVHIIRMQKWGVREHLDEGYDLLRAIIDTEEYTEYVLDRRLGCRQLGMNLPTTVTARKIMERYSGRQEHLRGITIWSPYFERDYIGGIATDKIPDHHFENGEFAVAFARLLGQAAAPNIVVGRCDLEGRVLFDDGDEVVLVDRHGIPREIVVSDQTGTFANFRSDLREFAPEYARPIIRRIHHVPDAHEFAAVYLDAFRDRFFAIQREYRRRKRGFDNLFRHRELDEGGSFAYRWQCVLRRLDQADPNELAEVIRTDLLVK